MSTPANPLANLPALPAGWTYNAAGQPVPQPMVAGVTPTASDSFTSIENWFTESTLFTSLPNWATVAIGLGGLMMLSNLFGGGGRRRR